MRLPTRWDVKLWWMRYGPRPATWSSLGLADLAIAIAIVAAAAVLAVVILALAR